MTKFYYFPIVFFFGFFLLSIVPFVKRFFRIVRLDIFEDKKSYIKRYNKQ